MNYINYINCKTVYIDYILDYILDYIMNNVLGYNIFMPLHHKIKTLKSILRHNGIDSYYGIYI